MKKNITDCFLQQKQGVNHASEYEKRNCFVGYTKARPIASYRCMNEVVAPREAEVLQDWSNKPVLVVYRSVSIKVVNETNHPDMAAAPKAFSWM